MIRKIYTSVIVLTAGAFFISSVFAQEIAPQVTEIKQSEIKDQTNSQVIIREHPKTGKPYVSIVSSLKDVPPDPFTNQRNRYSRPDYRMLDPNAKKSDYYYDGPYSDRTKVYIFGATLIAGGITGGALGMAAAPAATGVAAASGGGGAYLGGAAAVTAAGGAAYYEFTKVSPEDENYTHISESQTLSDGKINTEKMSETTGDNK